MKNKGLVIAGIIFVGVVIYLKSKKDKTVAVSDTKEGDSNFSSADCGCGA